MNCNQSSDGTSRMPGMQQIPMQIPLQGPGPVRTCGNMMSDRERFPVGMGYVPMQSWETPYPMEQAFVRGTIFPSLDYPFMMGRCRRWPR